MNPHQVEVVKGLTLANEFLKILRSFRLEQNRTDPVPHDVSEALANAHLKHTMETFDLDPEHLVWGLVNVVEMFLRLTDTDPEDLSGAIDRFLELAREQENKNG